MTFEQLQAEVEVRRTQIAPHLKLRLDILTGEQLVDGVQPCFCVEAFEVHRLNEEKAHRGVWEVDIEIQRVFRIAPRGDLDSVTWELGEEVPLERGGEFEQDLVFSLAKRLIDERSSQLTAQKAQVH